MKEQSTTTELDRLMDALGLDTQNKVAQAFGVTHQSVSLWRYNGVPYEVLIRAMRNYYVNPMFVTGDSDVKLLEETCFL